MRAASPIHKALMIKELQMEAQSHLQRARSYKKADDFEMALASYDQAKVTFKNAENIRKRVPPLSELKKAFSRAHTPQTSEDESLRQRIAEVYFERFEVLKSLEEHEKAQKSYEKAQEWGYKGIPALSISALLPSVDSAIGLTPSTEFFPSRASLLPKVLETCPQEKHQWVAQVFETILKQFQDLDLCQSSPSLFLVYAHNNKLGKADAEVSQRVIQWLSNLRSNLYSDRTASGHQALPLPATPEDRAKVNDILSSQLCLLPNHAGTVDQVILCGSELLGHYMASPYYQGFCEAIQRAYREASQTHDFAQIEAAIRKVVEANVNEEEFHHVLTELAFLQIRYEHKKSEHRIIPLLLNSTAQQCLPKFIVDSTTIRIEDSKWRTPSNWNGERYQDEGLHIAFFKLLNRLLGEQKRCIPLMEEKVYRACLQKLQEDCAHTLTAEAFSLFLNQTCVTALEALKQDHSADLRELDVQKAYESLLTEIKQINGESLVAPDQLRSALEASYSAKRLAIQRLSGSPLPMEHCYINLAVVGHEKIRKNEETEKGKEKKITQRKAKTHTCKEQGPMPSSFHRLPSVETIDSNPQEFVSLERLFEPQELSDGKQAAPKRILIRGRAGMGKTTLSKKIVYEYTQKKQWRDRFDYLLWIPLRTLKGKQRCDWVTLFHQTYFHTHPKGLALAQALEAQIKGPAQQKTLFVLDGWDEVAQEWGEHEPMAEFLTDLLNQPAVLITSRPHVALKQVQAMDLELETMGFKQENVTAYLGNMDIVSASDANEIKRFIKTNAVIQGLVNVPVQLDALCYSWDEIKRVQQETPDEMTITTLYQAMMNKLWRKDMLRLGKQENGKRLLLEAVQALRRASRIEQVVRAESDFLSALAFQGLQDNLIEFDTVYIDNLIEQLMREGVSLPITLEANLKELSFLHTDGAKAGQWSPHFVHLTFQEFFAAKHFVTHWETGREITLLSAHTHRWTKAPGEAFVREHKYNPRYEIFWWFVSGLLRGEALDRFFALLEAEPRDLFGAPHQRLMMSCLREASRAPGVGLLREIRDGLEQHLAQWLLWEADKQDTCTLAYQPTFPEHLLLNCLKETASEKTKRAVARALGYRAASSDAAWTALLMLANDEDKLVKRTAVEAIGKQSSLPELALQSLLALAKDPYGDVRYAAAQALAQQSSLPESVLPALLALTKERGSDVKLAATRALGNLSSLPESALRCLIVLATDTSKEVKRAAATALSKQSSLPEFAIQALHRLTKSQDSEVRGIATMGLGQYSSLEELGLGLLELMMHRSWTVANIRAHNIITQSDSLFFLQPGSVLHTLLELAQDQDEAATGLSKLPSLSESGLQTLLVLAKDKSSYVRAAAADALNEQSSLPESTLQALLALGQNQDWDVRFTAGSALRLMSSLPDSALSVLLMLGKDKNQQVRCAAAETLGEHSDRSEFALQVLIALVQNQDSDVRYAAAEALGKQSSRSESVLQALLALTQNQDRGVRSAAAKALALHHGAPDRLLTRLNREQIELIYTEYILGQRFDKSMPCYILDNSLCFYTAKGLQAVPLSDAKDKFKEVMQQAQRAAGIPLPFHSTLTGQALPTDEKNISLVKQSISSTPSIREKASELLKRFV